MTARKPPEAWFWSHDIQAEDLASVINPGTRLARLASYGAGAQRRFAALMFTEPGPERSWALDLDAAALTARLADTGARAVSITASTAPAGDASGGPRFSVVLESGPGSLSTVHVGLDEAGVRALLDGHHTIADLATYVAGGSRKYAVILEEHDGPSWLLAGLASHELDKQLLEHGAQLTRLRSYPGHNGRRELVGVAERIKQPSWAWYADLDGDTVARNLENNDAYPFDLDAVRDERGVRFSVVMYRQRG